MHVEVLHRTVRRNPDWLYDLLIFMALAKNNWKEEIKHTDIYAQWGISDISFEATMILSRKTKK